MGLTSNKILGLAVLLAVLLFVGTIWLWPRLARRSWRAITGRVGLLIATQLAIFASVGLAANQAFGFYATWADLFGQETAPGRRRRPRSGQRRAVPSRCVDTQTVNVPGGGRPVDRGPDPEGRGQRRTSRRSPARRTSTCRPSTSSRSTRSGSSRRPSSLTGYPGTAEALIKGLHYPQTAHEQAGDGKMQPMILVMMRPTVAPPRDTECVDIPGGPQTETFFAKDLPRAVSDALQGGRRSRRTGASSATPRAATAP